MKKTLLFLAALALFLSACSCSVGGSIETTLPTTQPQETAASTAPTQETTAPTTPTQETTQPAESIPETTQPTEPPVSETVPAEELQLPLPGECAEFFFQSGAGGWNTTLTVNSDGSFTGVFHDSEMGDRTEEYPNGTVYLCVFSGSFAEIEQVSDYAYEMKLLHIQTEHQEGEEWIEEEIRYIASRPYGLDEGTDFRFYLPETPMDQVPEGVIPWWPYRYDLETNPRDTLSCYGIVNLTKEYGFFNEQ